jgi:exoribonuclease R
MQRKIVGVLELSSKYKYGLTARGNPLFLFRPYDEAEPEYIVGSSERDLSRNQIAIVEVTTPEPDPDTVCTLTTKPRGVLVRLMGMVGDVEAERFALLQHYCPLVSLPSSESPPPPDDPPRLEISEATGWITFHIDPAGCRDIDDAIAQLQNGVTDMERRLTETRPDLLPRAADYDQVLRRQLDGAEHSEA